MKRKLAIIIWLLLCFGGCVYYLRNLDHKVSSVMKNACDTTYKHISDEYLKLFDIADNGNFNIIYTNENKFRNPISCFVYNNFEFQIYKIQNVKGKSLKNLIDINLKDLDKEASYDSVYSVMEVGDLSVHYKIGFVPKVDSIHFTLNGSDIETIMRTDSLIYYYTKVENFSIRYNKEHTCDIYGTQDKKFKSKPSEILFLRRDGNLYLILASSYYHDLPFKKGTLYSYLKK